MKIKFLSILLLAWSSAFGVPSESVVRTKYGCSKQDGTCQVHYEPAADNDQARGVALIQAITEAQVGDVVRISTANFDVGGVHLEAQKGGGGVSIVGLNSTIRSHHNYTVTGQTAIHLGNGSVLEGVTVQADGAAVCWGVGFAEAATSSVVLNSKCKSATTGVRIEIPGSRMEMRDVTIEAAQMGLYLLAANAELSLWDLVLDTKCGSVDTSAIGAYLGGDNAEAYFYGALVETSCPRNVPGYPAARGFYFGIGTGLTVYMSGVIFESEGSSALDMYGYVPDQTLVITGSIFDPLKTKAHVKCAECKGYTP